MVLQRYLLFALMEARREHAEAIRPGHVLLGLKQGRQAVSRLLEKLSIETARATLAPTPAGSAEPLTSVIPHSADTDRLVRRAEDEARALEQPMTEEHLLLALFSDEVCARVLEDAGVTERALRDRLTHRSHTPVRFDVGPSPDATLILEPYDPTRHASFAWILSQEHFANMKLPGAVLTNTSSLRVTAVVARWTFTDLDGDTRTRDHVADDYFVYNRFQKLAAGRSVLVSPSGFVEPLKPGSGYFVMGGSSPRPEHTAVAATLDIDSVVFEDGRLVGDDTYDIGGYLHGRHAAATALMREVDAAELGGEAPEEAMKRIHRRTMESRKPGERPRWHFLPHGSCLKQFRDLPPPPSFVRR
jgi:hypothetical protein